MAKYNMSKSEAKKQGVKRVKISGSSGSSNVSKREAEKYGITRTSNSSSSSSTQKAKYSNPKGFEEAMKNKGGWDSFNRLSPEQQEFIRFNYSTAISDQKEDAKLLEDALAEATKQADPYWKGFLTIAKDELVRSFDDYKQTYQYQKDEMETKIKEIGEDLINNKNFYTLEQQSDLAKLKASYEKERDTVIEGAAENGVTFSTKREVPLQQLTNFNENVVSSTNRGYEKKIGDITTAATRDTSQLGREIQQGATALQSKLTDVGRTAEAKLGTENLPTLEGYNPLGNVSGQLYEDKVADIEARKDAIFAEKTARSLNF